METVVGQTKCILDPFSTIGHSKEWFDYVVKNEKSLFVCCGTDGIVYVTVKAPILVWNNITKVHEWKIFRTNDENANWFEDEHVRDYYTYSIGEVDNRYWYDACYTIDLWTPAKVKEVLHELKAIRRGQ